MLTVEFHRLQADGSEPVVRTLTFDGREYHLNPPDDDALARLLSKKVPDPTTRRPVTAHEPERFMAGLQFMYRSAYYWAGPPVGASAVQAV